MRIRVALAIVPLVLTLFAGCLGPGCDGSGVVRATAPRSSFDVVKEGYLLKSICLRAGRPQATISIFRSHIQVALEGTLVGGDAGTNQAPSIVPDRWDAQEVPFGASARVRQAYAERLLGLNATLTWNNTLLGGAGDLAIGLGSTPEQALFWHDADGPQVDIGPHHERLNVTLRDFNDGWRGADTLYAGAGAGKAYASATGIAYRLDLEAYFGERHGAGLSTLAVVLAALAIAAMAFRRRAGNA